MSEHFLVFFRTGACSLESAKASLESYHIDTTLSNGLLIASRPDSSEFSILLVSGEDVLIEAKEIGEGTEYEKEMNECGSRFEVSISDFDTAIDEINTMMEVQGALQDASKGYLYLPWNGNLSEPWQE